MKVKTNFINILAIVSIIGFMAVIIESFFEFSVNAYVTPLVFIIIGIGLVIEGGVRHLVKMLQNGLSPDETTHILAIAIGILAIISGLLSLPDINIVTPTFTAIKGVLSIFAVIIIALETWLVK